MADYTDIDKLRELRGPEVGHINFGGGMAEKYLGDGRWQVFLEDERHCPRLRHGIAHEAHEYSYVYQRSYADRGLTTGSTYCDGLAEQGEPFPSIVAELQGLRTEVDQLRTENGELRENVVHMESERTGKCLACGEDWTCSGYYADIAHEARVENLIAAERDALQAEVEELRDACGLVDHDGRVAALQARIDAVTALHTKSRRATGFSSLSGVISWAETCDYCSQRHVGGYETVRWPCDTIRALGVDPQKETQQ